MSDVPDAEGGDPGRARCWPAARTTTGSPLKVDDSTLEKLHLEYEAEDSQRPFSAKVGRSLAVLGMYVALYVLCGFYIYHRDPRIIDDLGRLATLLALVVVTVSLMILTSQDEWRAELIPLMLFGMTVAIAYEQEIALLLSAAVTLISVTALGPYAGRCGRAAGDHGGRNLAVGPRAQPQQVAVRRLLAAGVAALTTHRRRHVGRRADRGDAEDRPAAGASGRSSPGR